MAAEKSRNIFENSLEGTMGARIKVLLAKTGLSPSAFEEKYGVGNGTLKSWKDESVEKSTNTIKNFLNEAGINKDWWKTGEGEPFLTLDEIEAAIPENPMHVNSVYKDLVEGNSEYSLIPKTVMAGEYRLILDRDITWRMEIITSLMDAKNQTIKDLRERLEKAERTLEELRSTPIKQSQK